MYQYIVAGTVGNASSVGTQQSRFRGSVAWLQKTLPPGCDAIVLRGLFSGTSKVFQSQWGSGVLCKANDVYDVTTISWGASGMAVQDGQDDGSKVAVQNLARLKGTFCWGYFVFQVPKFLPFSYFISLLGNEAFNHAENCEKSCIKSHERCNVATEANNRNMETRLQRINRAASLSGADSTDLPELACLRTNTAITPQWIAMFCRKHWDYSKQFAFLPPDFILFWPFLQSWKRL